MKPAPLAFVVLLSIALAGCWEKQTVRTPQPHRMTAEDIGRYCGMNVLEHPGPKGHIFAASLIEPVWFSSARDAIAFTMLPEEPKDIQAIYVSDMGRAQSWENPGADNWIEARKALFVIESRVKGGMGGDEAVPFSDRSAAETFVGRNGGRIVAFDQIPRDYVLASAGAQEGVPADDNGDARQRPSQ